MFGLCSKRSVLRMTPPNPDQHLSQIATLWSMVEQAHGPDADAATAARQRLLQALQRRRPTIPARRCATPKWPRN